MKQENMLKSMTISRMTTVKTTTLSNIDQHASLNLFATQLVLVLMDAEKSKHGSGPTPTTCLRLMRSVFCHQLIEEKPIRVTPRRSSSGPTLVISDKPSLSKFMAQRIKLLLKL